METQPNELSIELVVGSFCQLGPPPGHACPGLLQLQNGQGPSTLRVIPITKPTNCLLSPSAFK